MIKLNNFIVITMFFLIPMISHTKYNQTQKEDVKPILIIDPMTILFKENKSGVIKRVGFGNLTSYTIKHWKNPRDTCLGVLEKMSNEAEEKPIAQLKYMGYTMPRCIEQWHMGQFDNQAIRNKITAYIQQLDQQQYFKSQHEKNITEEVLNLSFNPNEIQYVLKPAITTIQMIQDLKKKGYQIFAITNIAHDAFDVVKKLNPDLFTLFSGIVISAEVKLLKPDRKIFEHLFTQYKINPKNCIYIDTQEKHLAMGEQLGMQVIDGTPGKKVIRAKLKNFGIS